MKDAMDNVIDVLKNMISPHIAARAAEITGESEDGISKALSGIFPLLMGGMIKKAGDSSSLSEVINTLKDAPDPGMITDHPTEFLGTLTNSSGQAAGIGGFLSGILGNKMQDAVDFIANYAGIKSSSASSLLSLGALPVMSILGSKLRASNLSPSGLISYLMGQKSNISNAMPAGLGNMLGLGNLDNLGENLSQKTQANVNALANETRKTASHWPLILGLAILLLGALFLWRNCSMNEVKNQVESTTTDATNATQSMASHAAAEVSGAAATVEHTWGQLGEFFSKRLPDNVELNIPKQGIENKFIGFIEDPNKPVDTTTWFTFDRLRFQTGSATLDPASTEQLTNITAIMKAYPEVEIKIGGYTDNTGSAESNLKLSQDRADSVKKELVKMGISENRIGAEGYGEEHPVASNDTEEGRAQNRRIDLRVTKK